MASTQERVDVGHALSRSLRIRVQIYRAVAVEQSAQQSPPPRLSQLDSSMFCRLCMYHVLHGALMMRASRRRVGGLRAKSVKICCCQNNRCAQIKIVHWRALGLLAREVSELATARRAGQKVQRKRQSGVCCDRGCSPLTAHSRIYSPLYSVHSCAHADLIASAAALCPCTYS